MNALFSALWDDAATFPPGNLPLPQAITAHHRHRSAAHAVTVGSFVAAAKDLCPLARLVADRPRGSFGLTVTAPLAQVACAAAAVATISAVRLTAVEVTLPDELAATEVVDVLTGILGRWPMPVFVEIPRDHRQQAVIGALAGSRYRAKLRTGGTRADLYPDEKELATAVVGLVAAGVPFKATAGLHHALRNTDPYTGFEQHGFLNLMAATAAAADGADVPEVARLLGVRAPDGVVDAVTRLDPGVRNHIRSVGTCSIAEPIGELVQLGLLSAHYLEVPA